MFLTAKKQQKTIWSFSLDSLIVTKDNISSLNESSDSKSESRKWNIVQMEQWSIKRKLGCKK